MEFLQGLIKKMEEIKMNYGYKNITINEIPELEGEGYIWMSDKNTPQLISNSTQMKHAENNPYIVEGYFVDKSKNTSIQIKNDGSGARLGIIDFNAIQADLKNGAIECDKIEIYLSHRLNDKSLEFKQAWAAIEDENCDKMPVLKPIWKAFVGFKTTNEK